MQDTNPYDPVGWHGTTILCVRRGGIVAMAGDGQVTLGQTVIKGNARKVRRIGAGGAVLAGFAGATADAFTLLERLEAKLERFPNQLERACVELAKDWRTDRYLRRLEAMMAVADAQHSYTLTGNGDVLEPEDGVIAIGSGGNYALAAARALMTVEGLRRGGDRAPGHADRRRHLRLHQPFRDRGNPVNGRHNLFAARDRGRARPLHRRPAATPSAPWPSRCATAGAGSSCRRACARRSCRRTS